MHDKCALEKFSMKRRLIDLQKKKKERKKKKEKKVKEEEKKKKKKKKKNREKKSKERINYVENIDKRIDTICRERTKRK